MVRGIVVPVLGNFIIPVKGNLPRGLAARETAKVRAKMPPPRKSPPPLGRYTQQGVRVEVEKRLAASPAGAAKSVAAALGFKHQSALNKRQDGDTPWTVDDLGRLADFFDPKNEHPGWPLVPWEEARGRPRRRGSRS